MFPFYRPGTMDDRPLTQADPADLAQALAHALQYDGRKRLHRGDGLMAQLMAEHLAKCLAQAGFVVMKRPPTQGHGSTGLHTPGLERPGA